MLASSIALPPPRPGQLRRGAPGVVLCPAAARLLVALWQGHSPALLSAPRRSQHAHAHTEPPTRSDPPSPPPRFMIFYPPFPSNTAPPPRPLSRPTASSARHPCRCTTHHPPQQRPTRHSPAASPLPLQQPAAAPHSQRLAAARRWPRQLLPVPPSPVLRRSAFAACGGHGAWWALLFRAGHADNFDEGRQGGLWGGQSGGGWGVGWGVGGWGARRAREAGQQARRYPRAWSWTMHGCSIGVLETMHGLPEPARSHTHTHARGCVRRARARAW